ncbi:hypothetical protein MX035_07520 [Streptococcus uberis]|nr:hypothetical protein [Streptococcus uberis]
MIEVFLKHGSAKSIQNDGQVNDIDKLVKGIANEKGIVLQGKRNTVVVPGHNISYIVIDK